MDTMKASLEALILACRNVIARFDAACEEQYDELMWAEFVGNGGIEELREALQGGEQPQGPTSPLVDIADPKKCKLVVIPLDRVRAWAEGRDANPALPRDDDVVTFPVK